MRAGGQAGEDHPRAEETGDGQERQGGRGAGPTHLLGPGDGEGPQRGSGPDGYSHRCQDRPVRRPHVTQEAPPWRETSTSGNNRG